MPPTWNNLYCRCDAASTVADTLRTALTAAGYTLYNPFGLIPGRSYPQSVRLFVAPAAAGWVRVIGELPDALLPPLSPVGLCLRLALAGSAADVTIYADGQPAEADTLRPYLRGGWTLERLRRAMAGEDAAPPDRTPVPDIPVDTLPPDVQALAGRVDPAQANKLFARLSGQMLERVGGGDEAEAARALLAGDGVPDWNSPGGRRIRVLLDALGLPDDWRKPDFTALRDAYQLHERRRRLPDARLYPGDAETMARVPDALDYQVVYGGRG